jgi:DNA-directed RNA polymerase specialized sigma24 family protein
MGRDVLINQESFDALLDWLDAEREVAGHKYEVIRSGLIKLFIARGCCDAEDLADLTINRVVAKLSTIRSEYVGEPTRYFYGVARNVILESRRRKEVPLEEFPLVAVSEETVTNAEQECLNHCLALLHPEQRDLMLDYYLNEKRLKIDHHLLLAKERGISVAALRVRAHRIRVNLEKCVRQCVELC